MRDKLVDLLLPYSDSQMNPIIVDPPTYANVGDSAIYIGELNFCSIGFPRKRVTIIDRYNVSGRLLRNLDDKSIIFMQGGGNFGDIWPSHHMLRLRIIEEMKKFKIVQFPQSIHFSDPDLLERTKRIVGNHKNFTMFVRDEKSFRFAVNNFDCETILAPDMAIMLNDIKSGRCKHDVFCLFRQDKEAISESGGLISSALRAEFSVSMGDWADRDASLQSYLTKGVGLMERKAPLLGSALSWANGKLRKIYCAKRLAFGAQLLSSGKVVVTDRLHAHILCVLLNIPHVILDSFDGKIRAFHATWTHDIDTCIFCVSQSDVESATRQLLSSIR